MIKFILVGNKMNRLRLSRFYDTDTQRTHTSKQQEVLRMCLKDQKQEGILEYQDGMVVYRIYTNLYFIAGISQDENELAILEFLQNFVETIIKYFEQVSEQDFLYNMDKVHMILDEMVISGHLAETNKARILLPLQLMDANRK